MGALHSQQMLATSCLIRLLQRAQRACLLAGDSDLNGHNRERVMLSRSNVHDRLCPQPSYSNQVISTENVLPFSVWDTLTAILSVVELSASRQSRPASMKLSLMKVAWICRV